MQVKPQSLLISYVIYKVLPAFVEALRLARGHAKRLITNIALIVNKRREHGFNEVRQFAYILGTGGRSFYSILKRFTMRDN